jgi:hypothetical protein
MVRKIDRRAQLSTGAHNARYVRLRRRPSTLRRQSALKPGHGDGDMCGVNRSTPSGRFAALLPMSTRLAGVAAPAGAEGGAPGNSFTVFGATPARDAAVVGLHATTVAAATQVYLRHDGGGGGGTDNHAINVGLRMSR